MSTLADPVLSSESLNNHTRQLISLREVQIVEVVDEEEDDGDVTCGCNFQCWMKDKKNPTRWLQQFATPKWALFFMACACFFQGFIVTGLMNTVLHTIEKRFGLSSSDSALILSSYNFSSCITLPIVSFLGTRSTKPKWVGVGMGIMGVGCLFFALPHFLVDNYQLNLSELSKHLCFYNQSGNPPSNAFSTYKYLFIFANALNGVGVTPLFTLAISYLDENVEQNKSSLYHGVFFAVGSAIGPAAGSLLGGSSLKLFTHIQESPFISTMNPIWIGAWWLCFLACGILLLMLCVPITMFPRRLPYTEKFRRYRTQEMHFNDLEEDPIEIDEDFGKKFSDFPKFTYILLRNPIFLVVAMASAVNFGAISGVAGFTPKYLESMFGLSPANSAYYLGIVIVFAGGFGYLCGGLIVTKAKLKVKGIINLCVFNSFCAILCSFIYLYSCSNVKFAGVTVPYGGNASSKVLASVDYDNQCNEDCQCDSNLYDPVCGNNDVTYLTPCYAGCTTYLDEIYDNCSCIVVGNHTLQTAKLGVCINKDCEKLPVFLFGLFGLLCFTTFCWTPSVQIIIRVVPFTLRPFALGALWFLNRLCGGIPFPLIFGRLFDHACADWSGENEDLGFCRIFHVEVMSRSFFYIVLSLKVMVFILYIIAGILYHPNPMKTPSKTKVNGSSELGSVTIGAISDMMLDHVPQTMLAVASSGKL